MMCWVRNLFGLALATLVFASPLTAEAAPIGMVNFWSLTTGVQDSFGDFTQTLQSSSLVQTPYVVHQTAQIGNSTADTYLNIVIDDHNLVLVVEPDHHCIHEVTHQSACISTGEVIIAPTQDVGVAFVGTYTYPLVGDPTLMAASISISKILPSGGQSITGQGIVRDSLFGPLSGTQNYSKSAILPAGSQYRIVYHFVSLADDPQSPIGSTVTGSGAFQIDVHPVPEPAMLFPLAFASILIRRRRIA